MAGSSRCSGATNNDSCLGVVDVQGADSDAAAGLRERMKKLNATLGDNGKRL